MSLPKFNDAGDLPAGLHAATIDDVVQRFGNGTTQRAMVTERLQEIFRLAAGTGALDRLIVFGSSVSSVTSPNDVDVVLIMNDTFRLADCTIECRLLFDHQQATTEFGASIFWIRPAMLIGETLEQFIAHWQRKRDGQLRGIVEVRP